MELFMRMAHYRKDGFNMYTKLLRFLVRIERQICGHCDAPGEGPNNAHCY